MCTRSKNTCAGRLSYHEHTQARLHTTHNTQHARTKKKYRYLYDVPCMYHQHAGRASLDHLVRVPGTRAFKLRTPRAVRSEIFTLPPQQSNRQRKERCELTTQAASTGSQRRRTRPWRLQTHKGRGSATARCSSWTAGRRISPRRTS